MDELEQVICRFLPRFEVQVLGVSRNVIEQNLIDLPEPVLRKVLYENAARVYGIEATPVTG